KALQMGKELMFVLDNDSQAVTQYSKHLMCVDTGISYEEPSPNSFSFNSPYGACPQCKGLGTTHEVDMDAVIPDPTVSITDGAVKPLGEEREAHIFKQVQQLAKKHKINLSKSWKDLSETAQNIILFGKEKIEETDLETLDMSMGESMEGPVYYTTEFEGVIPMLRRWFAATNTTEALRDWVEQFMILKACPSCSGMRLRKESLWFKIDQKNIAEISNLGLDDLQQWFSTLEKRLSTKQNQIAKDILKEIRERLGFLLDVGLTYLTLDRPSKSLSGGEYQRIRLATQIGSQLQGITYILDEPSIGLHQRDNHRLIQALQNLRDIGNSVLVVEHDKDIMLAADHLVDIGPRAGFHGGRIVAAGKPADVLKS
ncbi:MAG TPA: excinuclease ABC subunit UvrA, partial [Ferruginibacter sp.]|nr:excinuclease ABC subunit UvrA [Ferruginibacter sp.]